MKDAWFKEHLMGARAAPPFSVTYDGLPSAKLHKEQHSL